MTIKQLAERPRSPSDSSTRPPGPAPTATGVLQRTFGNQTIQQFVRRKCTCEESAEEETCGPCSMKHAAVRRSAIGGSASPGGPTSVDAAVKGAGQPLDIFTRRFMESAFTHATSIAPIRAGAHPLRASRVVSSKDPSEREADDVARRVTRTPSIDARGGRSKHDFGGVRVHTSAAAAESARALGARAFAMGNHIGFAAGEYHPSTEAGRELLAHELAHVVQSRGATAIHDDVHCKKFDTDERACTATIEYLVQLLFDDTGGDKWTDARKKAFRSGFTQTVKSAFNGNSFRIKPSIKSFESGLVFKDAHDCPCADTGFKPLIAIELVPDDKWSVSEDLEVDVAANAAGTYEESNAYTWMGYANLDEADLKAVPKKSSGPAAVQADAAHEFGHFLGLEHPGKGVEKLSPNANEYGHIGTDVKGRAVHGPTDLMGSGMGLRPFYFDEWRDELKDKYGENCNWKIVGGSAAAASKAALKGPSPNALATATSYLDTPTYTPKSDSAGPRTDAPVLPTATTYLRTPTYGTPIQREARKVDERPPESLVGNMAMPKYAQTASDQTDLRGLTDQLKIQIAQFNESQIIKPSLKVVPQSQTFVGPARTMNAQERRYSDLMNLEDEWRKANYSDVLQDYYESTGEITNPIVKAQLYRLNNESASTRLLDPNSPSSIWTWIDAMGGLAGASSTYGVRPVGMTSKRDPDVYRNNPTLVGPPVGPLYKYSKGGRLQFDPLTTGGKIGYPKGLKQFPLPKELPSFIQVAQLGAHERAGGHLIAEHVGKTPEQMRARLASKPSLPSVSTFFDEATAEKVVSVTLDANQAKITSWLQSTSNEPTIVYYTFGEPVGWRLERGPYEPVLVSRIRLDLIKDAKMPLGYRIHNGYPGPP